MGKHLHSDAPHNGGRHPPRDAPPPPAQYATMARKGTTLWDWRWDDHHPRGTQPPQGTPAKGTVFGPHTRTPAPTARRRRTPVAPRGRAAGEGERLASDAPRKGATRATRAAGGAPSAYTNTRTPARGAGVRGPVPTPHTITRAPATGNPHSIPCS